VDGACIGQGDDRDARRALEEADLVFTAVGEPNLPALVPLLAQATQVRSQDRPLRILCGENGVDIARGLREAVAGHMGRDPARALRVGDTVMGRMCRVVERPSPPVRPVAPGIEWAAVSEPFYGIPVEEHAVDGLARIPLAVRSRSPARFSAAEDNKMLAHNGLHLVLGALGYLRGALYFSDLREEPDLMELAQRLLAEEVAPTLLRKHAGALDRNECLNYCDSILRRITCPVFHDDIERGVRGIMRKLQPWERLVYSIRAVAEQGIEPVCFATGLAGAVFVGQRSGETEQEFREVLTEHCGFDPSGDARLIDLITARRDAVEDGEAP
jgi:mannitol-1-phosphate/altronate dehydrogenase